MPTQCLKWRLQISPASLPAKKTLSPTKRRQSQHDILIQYFPAWKVVPGGPRAAARAARGAVRGDEAVRSADSWPWLGGRSAVGLHPRGWEGINRKECWLEHRARVLEISAWHTRCTLVGTKPVNAALAIGRKIVANAQKSCKSELLLYFTRKFLH